MPRISYTTPENRWVSGKSDLASLLINFRELGGEPMFLLRVLEKCDMHPIFFINGSDLEFHRSCGQAMLKAATVFEQTGFDRKVVDDAMLCSAVHSAIVKIKTGLRGNPVQSRRYFWAGALLPYLVRETGTERWSWLERWITYVEQRKTALSNSLRVSIPKGTRFLKQKAPAIENVQQKLVHKSLLLGVDAGITCLKAAQREPADLPQRIEALVQLLQGSRLQPKHYELIKLMLANRPPQVPTNTTPLAMGSARLWNRMVPPRSGRVSKGRPATRSEAGYYEQALKLWPGLEPGLKISILKAGIRL